MVYKDRYGVEFSDDRKTLVRCPEDFQGEYVIPNSVTNIGDGAFFNCLGLTSITIPNSVTSIGNWSFIDNSFLIRFCSVTSIGYPAFLTCSSLTKINVAIDNPNYCSADGVLFNKSKTLLISYPRGGSGDYTIPNSVTSIGDGAFFDCFGLTSITIPNSITSIGENAFYGCSGLKEICVPKGQKNRFIELVGSDLADKIVEQENADSREMTEIRRERVDEDIISNIVSVEVVNRPGLHNEEYDYDDYLAMKMTTIRGDVGYMRLYHLSKLKEGDKVDPKTLEEIVYACDGEEIIYLDGKVF